MGRSEPTFRVEEPDGFDAFLAAVEQQVKAAHYLDWLYDRFMQRAFGRQPQLEEALFEIGEALVGDGGTERLVRELRKDPTRVRDLPQPDPSPTLHDLFGDEHDNLHPADREALEEMGAGQLRAGIEDVDLRAPGVPERVPGGVVFTCGKVECDGKLVKTDLSAKPSEVLESDGVHPTSEIFSCRGCGALYELIRPAPETGEREPEMWRRADLEGHDG